MKREKVADGILISNEQGRASILRPRPHIELLRAEGYAMAEAAPEIIAQRNLIVAECGRIALFDDLDLLTGYDNAVRSQLTAWSRRNRPKIVAFHILTRSKLVAMGVAVANLVLGGSIRVHQERAAFEEALRREMETPSG